MNHLKTHQTNPMTDLIFVTNITNYIREDKIAMWRNFSFPCMTILGKLKISQHVEKFQMSPHDRCGEIWNSAHLACVWCRKRRHICKIYCNLCRFVAKSLINAVLSQNFMWRKNDKYQVCPMAPLKPWDPPPPPPPPPKPPRISKQGSWPRSTLNITSTAFQIIRIPSLLTPSDPVGLGPPRTRETYPLTPWDPVANPLTPWWPQGLPLDSLGPCRPTSWSPVAG